MGWCFSQKVNKEHHHLLHAGKLTRDDINKLSKYKGKIPDKKN